MSRSNLKGEELLVLRLPPALAAEVRECLQHKLPLPELVLELLLQLLFLLLPSSFIPRCVWSQQRQLQQLQQQHRCLNEEILI